MKKDSVKCMELLGIDKTAIETFENKGKVTIVDYDGTTREADAYEEKMIEATESKYPTTQVYYGIYSDTKFGKLLSMLITNDEDAKAIRDDAKCSFPYAWVINLDADWCSDYGAIAVDNRMGTLVRVG